MPPQPSSTSGPSSYRQPSRKTKRAWRKNVDVSEIDSGLETAREQYISTGGKLISDLTENELFQTDVAGDEKIQQLVQKQKLSKPLKADQILAERSKVPAVNARKRAADGHLLPPEERSKKRLRTDYVSRKELERLRRIAYSGERSQDLVQHPGASGGDDGPVDNQFKDLWAVEVARPAAPNADFLEAPQPTRAPKTLSQPPQPLVSSSSKPLPNIRKPHAGRSYNPAFDEWSALLAREGEKEVAREKKRLAAIAAEEQRAARAQALAETLEQKEKEQMMLQGLGLYSDEEADGGVRTDSEWEGFESELDERELMRKRPGRLTPAERNKVKRRQARERQEKHDRKMRLREKDMQERRLAEIAREMEVKKAPRAGALVPAEWDGSVKSDEEGKEWESEEDVSDEEATRLARRAFRKKHVPEPDLEITLPDELRDSLRALKPEGSLLRDRYRNLLIQGKVEARKPFTQPKKAKRTVTEKWTSKDWVLPIAQ